MRDQRPARCTGPWTWPGPSLSARSPTPTESRRLAEKVFSSTVFKGYLCAPDDRELQRRSGRDPGSWNGEAPERTIEPDGVKDGLAFRDCPAPPVQIQPV